MTGAALATEDRETDNQRLETALISRWPPPQAWIMVEIVSATYSSGGVTARRLATGHVVSLPTGITSQWMRKMAALCGWTSTSIGGGSLVKKPPPRTTVVGKGSPAASSNWAPGKP